MEITWYGRACFRLKGKDATVITDPCPPATGFVAGKHDVELLTISHDHPDHTYTRSITAGLTLTRPGEYEFSDLLVTGVKTYHDGEGGTGLVGNQRPSLGQTQQLRLRPRAGRARRRIRSLTIVMLS